MFCAASASGSGTLFCLFEGSALSIKRRELGLGTTSLSPSFLSPIPLPHGSEIIHPPTDRCCAGGRCQSAKSTRCKGYACPLFCSCVPESTFASVFVWELCVLFWRFVFFSLSCIDLLGHSPEPECAHLRVRRVCHVFYSHFVFLFHLLSSVQLPPFQETIPSHCQSGLAATALSSSAARDFSLPLSLVPLSPISLTQPPSGVRAQAECEKAGSEAHSLASLPLVSASPALSPYSVLSSSSPLSFLASFPYPPLPSFATSLPRCSPYPLYFQPSAPPSSHSLFFFFLLHNM